jgi:hypothetical protein
LPFANLLIFKYKWSCLCRRLPTVNIRYLWRSVFLQKRIFSPLHIVWRCWIFQGLRVVLAKVRDRQGGFRIPPRPRNFLLARTINIGSGTHAPSYSMGTSGPSGGESSWGVAFNRSSDLLPSFKNEWSCTSSALGMPSWRREGQL